MTLDVLKDSSIEQYKLEERSLLAKRAVREKNRLKGLLNCMKLDKISSKEKINELKKDLFTLTGDVNFKKSSNMGETLISALDYVIRNYKNENPYIIK